MVHLHRSDSGLSTRQLREDRAQSLCGGSGHDDVVLVGLQGPKGKLNEVKSGGERMEMGKAAGKNELRDRFNKYSGMSPGPSF